MGKTTALKAVISKEEKSKVNLTQETFVEFWKLYPRKVGKAKALKKWLKIPEVNFEKIMQAVETQKNCEQWMKDNGKFIPHPITWLNGERWEDEMPEPEYATHECTEEEANELAKELGWAYD